MGNRVTLVISRTSDRDQEMTSKRTASHDVWQFNGATVELVPTAKIISLLVNSRDPNISADVRKHNERQRLSEALTARREHELDAALATIRADALLVMPDPYFCARYTAHNETANIAYASIGTEWTASKGSHGEGRSKDNSHRKSDFSTASTQNGHHEFLPDWALQRKTAIRRDLQGTESRSAAIAPATFVRRTRPAACAPLSQRGQ
jgi:hypothetical protein